MACISCPASDKKAKQPRGAIDWLAVSLHDEPVALEKAEQFYSFLSDCRKLKEESRRLKDKHIPSKL
jgi:hypothetical protein